MNPRRDRGVAAIPVRTPRKRASSGTLSTLVESTRSAGPPRRGPTRRRPWGRAPRRARAAVGPAGVDPISAVRAPFLLVSVALECSRRPLEGHSKARTNEQNLRSAASTNASTWRSRAAGPMASTTRHASRSDEKPPDSLKPSTVELSESTAARSNASKTSSLRRSRIVQTSFVRSATLGTAP